MFFLGLMSPDFDLRCSYTVLKILGFEMMSISFMYFPSIKHLRILKSVKLYTSCCHLAKSKTLTYIEKCQTLYIVLPFSKVLCFYYTSEFSKKGRKLVDWPIVDHAYD